ncbi:MAG: nucleotidyltransferase [Bacteroidales bacterium]|nr:nucleotidyltransferase [Bacteroidales bacterium]
MKPTLLVLAAGMGSRYGGLKQMDGLGPSGETIIDYSIYDAVAAGFGKVVYIVREYFLKEFREAVARKYAGVKCIDGEPLKFEFVTQELDRIPSRFTLNPERQKPWGTAHAVLMAAGVINEPFAVINGDDFYGRESFKCLADWLRAHENSRGVYSIVGFELDNTLSESGGVSRGICHYDKAHILTGVVEHLNISREADGVVRGENSLTSEKVELDGTALCSMNMWGFTPDYFERSAAIFEDFLEANINEVKKEFYIPYAVDCMTRKGTARTEVLSTPSKWFGVTYREDRPAVVAKFAELARSGVYPTPLYGRKEK